MSPLITALSNWLGRRWVQAQLAERGFLTASMWQRLVHEYCGVDQVDEINRYWDEVAKECVCSAGQVNSKLRKFKGEATYRSEYLDQLALSVNYAEPPFREPELHRCLFEFDKRTYYDKAIAIDIRERLEKEKVLELNRLNITAVDWSGKKRDLKPFFEQYVVEFGFNKIKERFLKEGAKGLIFECWVDVGGQVSCGGNLPLCFFIYHKTDPGFRFEVSSFNRIVPGFGYYSYFKNLGGAILGIRAHVEMFDVMCQSLLISVV